MGMLLQAVGWADYLLTWVWAIWFGVGIVVGGVLLAFDEWRLYRARPKPDEVRAYAERLVAHHGLEASRINGEAMIAARRGKDFDRYRFLREVSGVLVDVPFGRYGDPRFPAIVGDASEPMCFPGASPEPFGTPIAKTADRLTR